jgi:hypothetical protein
MRGSHSGLGRKWAIGALFVGSLAAIGVMTHRSRREGPDAVSRSPVRPPFPLRLERLEGAAPELLAASDPARLRPSPLKGRRPDPGPRPWPSSAPAPRPPDGASGPVPYPGEDCLREKGGVLAYNSRRYAATWHPGTIEFGLTTPVENLGLPVLSFSLKGVTVGREAISIGDPPPPEARPENREIQYVRGALRETYAIRPDGIEQSFVIPELPAGRGAITVTGSIDTNLVAPADGTSSRSLAFRYHGTDVMSVSEAFAVDASGRRQPLDLAWTRGTLRMTVPAEWVAQATLPIVIDPLLSGFEGFGPQAAGIQGSGVDLAYNSVDNLWVAVYAIPFGAGGFDTDLYYDTILPTGIFQSSLGVATGPAQDSGGVVSYAPEVNRYLFAWQHKDTSTSDGSLMGRVLDAQTGWVGAAFPILDFTGREVHPSVAWDGTNWYVVCGNENTLTVRGRFVSSAGVPGAEVDPDLTSNLDQYPLVRFGNGVYLIMWTQEAVSGVTARTMTPSGTFLTPPTVISDPGDLTVTEDAAAGPGTFLVVWSTDSVVKARQFTSSLAPSGSTQSIFPREFVPGYATADQSLPHVIYSSTNAEWYVVYREDDYIRVNPFTVYETWMPIRGRHIGLNGSVSPFETLTEGMTPENILALSYNSQTNQALLAVGNGFVSSWARRIELAYPQAPAGFVAIPGNGLAELDWSPLAGATSYNLYRSDGPGAPLKPVASAVPGTSFVDTGLTNGITYTYQVTATVDFRETVANQAAATPSSQVLFVVGSTTLSAADAALRTRLQNAGFVVTVMNANATANDAQGKILVVISSTVNPATVGTKFRNLALPVVTWENGIYGNMGMTGLTSGTDFGTATKQTALTIVNPSHPLAAGLSGTVTVVTASSTFSWGVPNANAATVATLTANSSRAVIFGYATGAAMPGLAAPARRVGFFLNDTTAASINASGGALFDAAVSWATHSGPGNLAAPSSAPPAITIDGRGAYPTVQDAASAAQPGDFIVLGAGTFPVPGGLILKGGVSLRGAAPHQTVLDGSGAPIVVRLSGTAASGISVLEQLTVTGGSDGLNLGDAQVLLRNLQIVGLAGNGLVTGSQSAVEAVSLTVADNAGIGVVLGSAQSSLRGLILGRNTGGGIQGPAGARLTYSTVFGSAVPASGGISVTGTGMLSSAVTFMNASGRDYREVAGSTSINAGDPTDGFGLEPAPNGGRINQGAYGNTPFASP